MGRALMIVGTMSSVGKSTIVTGLCRIFSDMGLRVCPFKAQNISSRTVKLSDGSVISLAQYVQALAARVQPNPLINPLALVPHGGGTNVFLLGKSLGSVSIQTYRSMIEHLRKDVISSLQELLSYFDLVVVEGAGSPAELNVRPYDIANMTVAKEVGAPTLVVGDIERGGVFAQLLGTYWLLEPDERSLIRGFIVNKFRGDPAFFDDGVGIIERMTGLPVLGVVPYVPNHLPAEDSFSDPQSGVRENWNDAPELEKSIRFVAKTLRDALDVEKILSIAGF